MVAVVASNAPGAAGSAIDALSQIVAAGDDLAVRVISTPGAPQALSQAALHCSDVRMAQRAAAALSVAALAGPEHASTVATPDVLAALVSAAGRAGMGVVCMGAFGNVAGASPHLALRVADTPGAEAAMLAALTRGDLAAATIAAIVLSDIAGADGPHIARLLCTEQVPAAFSRLLRSNESAAVMASTCEG
jgi:hypothetical protein